MTEETLIKAKKIQNDINFYGEVVSNLKYHERRATEKADFGGKIQKWMLKIVNRKKKDEDEFAASLIIFDNADIYGSTIPVDAELLDLITEYFAGKRDRKKEELTQLK